MSHSHGEYRVIRKTDDTGAVSFHVHAVEYDQTGQIAAWSDSPVKPRGESLAILRADIQQFLNAFKQDVLQVVQQKEQQVLMQAYPEMPFEHHEQYAELVDRTYIVMSHCQMFVGSHPALRRQQDLSAYYERVDQALFELYQAAATLAFKQDQVTTLRRNIEC